MNKGMKKVSLFLCCCMAVIVICVFPVKAASGAFSYDTSSKVMIGRVVNDTSKSVTLSVNTRPTAGEGGVKVTITKSNGTVVGTHTFPYHTSVPSYAVSVPSGEVRRIYIQPLVSGQRIAGRLSYSF